MSMQRRFGWARGAGFVLGIALAVTAVLGWRLPRGTGHLGADVVVAFLQTGEIHVSSATPIVTASGLHPGASARGSVEVHNIGPSRLAVAIEAQRSAGALDRLLWIDITSGSARFYRGPIGGLRAGSPHRFSIVRGAVRTLDVRTWIPADVESGYEGQIEQVDLTFDARATAA